MTKDTDLVYDPDSIDNYLARGDVGSDKEDCSAEDCISVQEFERRKGLAKAASPKENFEKHTTGAIKETAGKVRLDLLPFDAIMEIGKIYTTGAEKYDDHNWRKGLFTMKHHIAAALRHIFKFSMGIDNDKESGHNHLAHACFHLMAVITNTLAKRTDLDDRVKE